MLQFSVMKKNITVAVKPRQFKFGVLRTKSICHWMPEKNGFFNIVSVIVSINDQLLRRLGRQMGQTNWNKSINCLPNLLGRLNRSTSIFERLFWRIRGFKRYQNVFISPKSETTSSMWKMTMKVYQDKKRQVLVQQSKSVWLYLSIWAVLKKAIALSRVLSKSMKHNFISFVFQFLFNYLFSLIYSWILPWPWGWDCNCQW